MLEKITSVLESDKSTFSTSDEACKCLYALVCVEKGRKFAILKLF